MPAKARKPRRKKAAPSSRGLPATEMRGDPPAEIAQLARDIEGDGGASLVPYRDPLSGKWLVLAALPIDQVAPTPWQRDLSDTHVKRLTDVIDKVGLFLDPVIATREKGKRYFTPNGSHRLAALSKLGARSITALVVPDPEVAFRILALNTEKSHNLKEKSLEAIRMLRALAADAPTRKESDLAFEFEEPVFLTLGICYEKNARFSGGCYRPPLRRAEEFLDQSVAKSLEKREARGAEVLALDEKVTAIIGALKARGIQSPYLRPFVTARINPVRFAKEVTMSPDEIVKKMRASAEKFDVAKVRPDQVTAVGAFGGGDEE